MIKENLLNSIIEVLKNEGVFSTKLLSDSYYTARKLYDIRLALFKIISHTYKPLAWKTKFHHSDKMFDDSFLVGIDTPTGPATYHFKIKHYEEFDLHEIAHGPKYDGYTPVDAIERIKSLPVLGNEYFNTAKGTTYNAYNNFSASLIKSMTNTQYEKITRLLNSLLIELKNLKLMKTTNISDGHHTFEQLHMQKRELFKLICHNYSDLAWKSKYDADGVSIDDFSKDTFLAGIDTPCGPVCLVLNNSHYKEFQVKELNTDPLKIADVYKEVLGKLSSLFIRQYKANQN